MLQRRNWQRVAERHQAHGCHHCAPLQLCRPIYDWFTEGFDAPDLKEAKALLDELA
jgi:hypothetical protein